MNKKTIRRYEEIHKFLQSKNNNKEKYKLIAKFAFSPKTTPTDVDELLDLLKKGTKFFIKLVLNLSFFFQFPTGEFIAANQK